MVAVGNILLGIASLVFLAFSIDTFGKAVPGGDAGVGFAWVIVIVHVVLFIVFCLVAWIIGSRSGFYWVAPTSGKRFFFVAAGIIVLTIGSFMLSSREGFRSSPVLSSILALMIPALSISGLAVLLNAPTPTSAVQRVPLMAAVSLAALVCLPLAVLYVQIKTGNMAASILPQTRPDSNDLNMIEYINQYDTSNGIGGLLVYTDYHKHTSVREPALEKIKSYPNWQQQLADGLEKNWAPEVFTFLAANDPGDKRLFDKPIHDGIRIVAADVHKTLDEVYQQHHLYEGQYSWEVERIIRTLQKFEGNGEDYRPDMQAFREAFDTPCKVQKPDFFAVKALDKWLKKHQ